MTSLTVIHSSFIVIHQHMSSDISGCLLLLRFFLVSALLLSFRAIRLVLEALMDEFAVVGLFFNARKFSYTHETQPPHCVVFCNGEQIRITENFVGHGWLGCLLCAGPHEITPLGPNYYLRAAANVFFVNDTNIRDRKIHVSMRLHSFDRVIWLWTSRGVYSRVAQNGCCLRETARQNGWPAWW